MTLKRSDFFKALLFTLFALNACTEPELTSDDLPDVSNEVETITQINITPIPQVVEIQTDFNIEIIDDSDVTIKIMLDGVELLSTKDKDFMFTLDPFDHDIGTKNIEIKSINSDGKETAKNYSCELRRLLFRDHKFLNKGNYGRKGKFISLHKKSGELIELQKIENNDDGSFYANNDFKRQDLIVTRYEIHSDITNFSQIISYDDVKIGTIITIDPNNDVPGFVPLTEQFLFETDDVSGLVANNYNSKINYSDSENPTSFDITHSATEPKDYFVGTSPLIENPIENFRYLIIDDLNKKLYSTEDFRNPLRIENLQIPINDSFRLNVYGFKDEAGFSNYEYKEVYVSRVLNENKVAFPIIEEFGVYQAKLAYSYEATDVYIHQKDITVPMESPPFEVFQDGAKVNFTGNIDYVSFDYVDTNGGNILIWDFISPQKTMAEIPFYDFEIPSEIEELLNAKSLSLDIANPRGEYPALHCWITKGSKNFYDLNQLSIDSYLMATEDSFQMRRRLELQ